MNKDIEYYYYYSIILTTITLFIFYLIFKIYINDYSIFHCIIYDNFHIYCPGCGATRAFIAMLKLDLTKSLYYNPSVLYFTLLTIIYLITQTIERIKKRKKHLIKYKYIIYIGISIMIINCIIRNILLLKYNIAI